jgi:hypothetical protein
MMIGNRRLYYFYLFAGVCFNLLYVILSLQVDWMSTSISICSINDIATTGMMKQFSIEYCLWRKRPYALMMRYLSMYMMGYYLFALWFQTILLLRETSRFHLQHGRHLPTGFRFQWNKAWRIYTRFLMTGSYEIIANTSTSTPVSAASSSLSLADRDQEDGMTMRGGLLDHEEEDEFISDSDEEYDAATSHRHGHSHSHNHHHSHGHNNCQLDKSSTENASKSPSSMSISAIDRV